MFFVPPSGYESSTISTTDCRSRLPVRPPTGFFYHIDIEVSMRHVRISAGIAVSAPLSSIFVPAALLAQSIVAPPLPPFALAP